RLQRTAHSETRLPSRLRRCPWSRPTVHSCPAPRAGFISLLYENSINRSTSFTVCSHHNI
ncbi:unnamed protein product, partial [Ascophyllum nodosum]